MTPNSIFENYFGAIFKIVITECKKFRLLADVLNDLAMTLNLISPFFSPDIRNLIYCLSAICWSIVGVAGGCTRTAMTIHQARKDNASDVQENMKN